MCMTAPERRICQGSVAARHIPVLFTYIKEFGCRPVVFDSALHVVMEGRKALSSFGGQPYFSISLNSPHPLTRSNAIVWSNEGDILWSFLFTTFFLQLLNIEYRVYSGSSSSEAASTLGIDAFSSQARATREAFPTTLNREMLWKRV